MKRISILFILLFYTVFLGAQLLDENLLLYYPFNGNANDSSENGFDGLVHGATLTTDRYGNPNSAYYFDGINDFIEFPNSYILKPDLPISFSFWIKYNDIDAQNCVVFNTSFEENRSVGVYFNIQNSTKKFSVGYGDGSYNFGSSTRRSYVSNFEMDTTDWHLITVVVTGPQHMKIYFDCEWQSGGTYSGEGYSLEYSNYPGCIGRHDQDLHLPAYYFKGKIDEFRYWNRALLPADVEALCAITSLNDSPDQSKDFKVYPNPTRERINIKSDYEIDYNIKLYDQFGKLCFSEENIRQIDLSSLSNGLYVLLIKTANGQQFIEKIIKQ